MNYDDLLELFEHLGNFLKRLDVYMKIPLTALMTEIIAKIMVELLSMLRQAETLIKRGRISERFLPHI